MVVLSSADCPIHLRQFFQPVSYSNGRHGGETRPTKWARKWLLHDSTLHVKHLKLFPDRISSLSFMTSDMCQLSRARV